MNVLITGGAGYVGYSVVRALLEDLDEVHSISIYDNLSRRNFSFFTEARFDRKPVKFVQADILDGRTLEKALEGIDCVIHLAARVTTRNDDRDAHAFDQVNHWGTAQLAMAAEKSGVRKLIYVSSIAVYGFSDERLSEASQPDPFSFYGVSKLAGERQLESLRDKLDLFILRSGNVYGYNPSYRTDAVINRFMFNANFQGRIQVNGSGQQRRSFIHVDKLANVILQAVDGNISPGLYNAVEQELSINEIVDEISQLYPRLDVISVNHNLNLQDIKVELPGVLMQQIQLPVRSMAQELIEFKDRFSF